MKVSSSSTTVFHVHVAFYGVVELLSMDTDSVVSIGVVCGIHPKEDHVGNHFASCGLQLTGDKDKVAMYDTCNNRLDSSIV